MAASRSFDRKPEEQMAELLALIVRWESDGLIDHAARKLLILAAAEALDPERTSLLGTLGENSDRLMLGSMLQILRNVFRRRGSGPLTARWDRVLPRAAVPVEAASVARLASGQKPH